MNSFYLVGRVADEAEKFESANGVKVCRLRVSVEKGSKDPAETCDLYEVALFRNLAEENYPVGQCIGIAGKLQFREKENSLNGIWKKH